MAEIIKCPPGVAKNASLYSWQFGVDEFGPADLGRARRLASGDFTPCERAVLDIVLQRTDDMPQRELEPVLLAQIGASRSLVYGAAQRLAQHGKICRKKIGRQWYYARPGYHWLRPRQQQSG